MLRNRLLSIGVLLFAITVGLYVFFDGMIIPLCFVVLTVSCCFLCTIRFLRIKTAIIFSIVPIFALFWCSMFTYVFVPQSSLSGKAEVIVTEHNNYIDSQTYIARVSFSDCEISSGTNIRFKSNGIKNYSIGDVLSLDGSFSVQKNYNNSLADKVYYYFSGEISRKGTSDDLFSKARQSIGNICSRFLPSDCSGFVKSITSGDCSDMTEADYFIYSKCGSSHILSVSGLHLSIVIMSVYQLLKKLIRNKTVVLEITLFLIFLYCGITGFNHPCIRSGIMLAIMITGDRFSTASDSLTSLFFALGIILLFNPYSIASLSLQLSFLSTMGIIITTSELANERFYVYLVKSKVAEYLVLPFICTLSAFLFTLPITSSTFGIISFVAPIISIAIGFLFSPILILSYLMCFFGLFSDFVGRIFALPLRYMITIFNEVISFFVSFEFSAGVVTKEMELLFILIFAVSLIGILFFKRRLILKALISAFSLITLSLIIFSIIGFSKPRNDTLTLYDNGNGFCLYLYSEDESVLIEENCASGCKKLVVESGSLSCNKLVFIDTTVNDKYVFDLFNRGMNTTDIYLPCNETDNFVKNNILALARQRNCDIIHYQNEVMRIGNASITFTNEALEIVFNGKNILIPFTDIKYGNYYDAVVLTSNYSGDSNNLSNGITYICTKKNAVDYNRCLLYDRNEVVNISSLLEGGE